MGSLLTGGRNFLKSYQGLRSLCRRILPFTRPCKILNDELLLNTRSEGNTLQLLGETSGKCFSNRIDEIFQPIVAFRPQAVAAAGRQGGVSSSAPLNSAARREAATATPNPIRLRCGEKGRS